MAIANLFILITGIMKNLNLTSLFLSVLLVFLFGCKKPEPVASFTMDKSTAQAGDKIAFSNTSLDATAFLWDFGDGSTSTEQNPSHTYLSPGNYTVTLTATGEGGENKTSLSVIITIPINIIPGDGAMNISLAETWQTVQTKIGSDFSQYGAMLLTSGSSSYVIHPIESKSKGIYLYFLSVKSSFTLSTSDLVFLISLKQNFVGQTAKGIKMGSPLADVSAAYGTPQTHNTAYYYYGYNYLGINFYYEKTSLTVNQISIFTPGKKGTDDSILLMH